MNETQTITVRYWASARSAAGVERDVLTVGGPVTLAEVRARVLALHPEGRLGAVLDACSVLVGETPVATADPAQVRVDPGVSVEFLPPFAGG